MEAIVIFVVVRCGMNLGLRMPDFVQRLHLASDLGADPFKLATDPCEPLVRGIFTRADHLDEYLQCREIAGIGDIEMTVRSEEHTSELQSLMRISYAVFCLKKKQ